MFTTLTQLYMMYRYLLVFHGIYVTFSFLKWFLGTSYEYTIWMVSFVYDISVPDCPLQLEDKQVKDEKN